MAEVGQKKIMRALKTGPSAAEVHGAPHFYRAAYGEGGASYGSEIAAWTAAEARALAAQRKLGEKVYSGRSGSNGLLGIVETLLKPVPSHDDILRALHEAVFMCWIGLSAETITPREVLGDKGLIHRLVHISLGIYDERTKEASLRVAALQARELADRVPGWPSRPMISKVRKAKYLRATKSKKRGAKRGRTT